MGLKNDLSTLETYLVFERVMALRWLAVFVVLLILAMACGGPKPTNVSELDPTNTETVPTRTTSVVPPTLSPNSSPTPVVQGPSTLVISVNGDALQFNKDKLTEKAGSEVVLTFTNVSMVNSHNWVLAEAGARDDWAVEELIQDWISIDDRVIAHTKLLNPGQTGEIKFIAPAAGTYEFVCTFPGHMFTMFGDLVVTP